MRALYRANFLPGNFICATSGQNVSICYKFDILLLLSLIFLCWQKIGFA